MPRHAKRPRLGRGLSSLIQRSDGPRPPGHYQPADTSTPAPISTSPPPRPATPQTGELTTALLDAIEPNPHQPRRDFDQASLAGLAKSLNTHGLLQPILVSPLPAEEGQARYRLIAGERRLRAARLAGLTNIPCILKLASREQTLQLALIENLHRADLNPIERASAYRDLMDRFGLTQQQVADRLQQPRTTVANHLRLLDLCDAVQAFILSRQLSLGHAKVLASFTSRPDLQTQLAARCVRDGLSVRQLEALARATHEHGEAPPTKQGQSPKVTSPYLANVAAQLAQAVGTKVTIRPGRAKHTGRIVIEYYSLDDFDRIVGGLGAKLES